MSCQTDRYLLYLDFSSFHISAGVVLHVMYSCYLGQWELVPIYNNEHGLDLNEQYNELAHMVDFETLGL